jgi:hypothetical protein
VCFRGYGPSTNGKGYKRYRFPHDWRESAQKRENLCESDGTNFYHIKLPSDMNIEFPVWQKIVAFPNPTPDYYFRATFAPPI